MLDQCVDVRFGMELCWHGMREYKMEEDQHEQKSCFLLFDCC